MYSLRVLRRWKARQSTACAFFMSLSLCCTTTMALQRRQNVVSGWKGAASRKSGTSGDLCMRCALLWCSQASAGLARTASQPVMQHLPWKGYFSVTAPKLLNLRQTVALVSLSRAGEVTLSAVVLGGMAAVRERGAFLCLLPLGVPMLLVLPAGGALPVGGAAALPAEGAAELPAGMPARVVERALPLPVGVRVGDGGLGDKEVGCCRCDWTAAALALPWLEALPLLALLVLPFLPPSLSLLALFFGGAPPVLLEEGVVGWGGREGGGGRAATAA